jgi:predicted small metal-binding protein
VARYNYSCAAAGADSCGFETRTDNREELARQLADHLKAHNVKVPTQTIVRYLVQVAESGSRRA